MTTEDGRAELYRTVYLPGIREILGMHGVPPESAESAICSLDEFLKVYPVCPTDRAQMEMFQLWIDNRLAWVRDRKLVRTQPGIDDDSLHGRVVISERLWQADDETFEAGMHRLLDALAEGLSDKRWAALKERETSL